MVVEHEYDVYYVIIWCYNMFIAYIQTLIPCGIRVLLKAFHKYTLHLQTSLIHEKYHIIYTT